VSGISDIISAIIHIFFNESSSSLNVLKKLK